MKYAPARPGAPCWVDLFSSDTAASKAFYGELFGWDAAEPNEEFGGYTNFLKDNQPIAGCMHNDGASGTPDLWSVYLAVEDAPATEAAAAGHGGTVIVPTMPVGTLGKMLLVIDAGGAPIGAWQPGDHKGFTEVGEPGTPCWFEMYSRSYDDAVRFYVDVFGWDAQVMSDTEEFRYTTLGPVGNALAGVMDGSSFLPEGVPSHWSVYFGTADTDASLAKAVELGATVVDAATDTPYGRLASANDPTGANFKLMQPPT